jgi:hypothetical protein
MVVQCGHDVLRCTTMWSRRTTVFYDAVTTYYVVTTSIDYSILEIVQYSMTAAKKIFSILSIFVYFPRTPDSVQETEKG